MAQATFDDELLGEDEAKFLDDIIAKGTATSDEEEVPANQEAQFGYGADGLGPGIITQACLARSLSRSSLEQEAPVPPTPRDRVFKSGLGNTDGVATDVSTSNVATEGAPSRGMATGSVPNLAASMLVALSGVSTVPSTVQQLSFVETKTPCTKNGQKKVVKAARADTDDPPSKKRRTRLTSKTSVAPSAASAAVAKVTPKKKTSPKTSAAHSADSAHSTKQEKGPPRASKRVEKEELSPPGTTHAGVPNGDIIPIQQDPYFDEGDLELDMSSHNRKNRAYKRARKDYENKGYDEPTAREYASSCARQAAARLSTGEDVD